MPEMDKVRALTIAEEVMEELSGAMLTFSKFNSAHEGYAVILEELEELWEEIKKKNPSDIKMKREAIQLTAMGMRFLYDLCYVGYRNGIIRSDAETAVSLQPQCNACMFIMGGVTHYGQPRGHEEGPNSTNHKIVIEWSSK